MGSRASRMIWNRTWMPAASRLLLGLAAASLLGCASEEQSAVDWSAPEVAGSELVVAVVDGEPITAGEVFHRIRIQYPKMPQSGPDLGLQVREVVKAMIADGCLVRHGETQGYDQTEEFRRHLELSRAYMLTRRTVSEELALRSTPREEEISRFYKENRESFRVRPTYHYRQIRLATEDEARRLQGELEAGADFALLAETHSTDAASAANGGQVSPFLLGTLAVAPRRAMHDIRDVLVTMEPGQVSAPIATAEGWFLVQLDRFEPERVAPLEEVRASVISKIGHQTEMEIYRGLLDSLKVAYAVTTYDDALEEFYLLQMSEEQWIEAADGEQDLAQRVHLLESFLEHYPESERGGEVLFTIGFNCAEHLDEPGKALEVFERFLADYPEHELAASARRALPELRRRAERGATGP